MDCPHCDSSTITERSDVTLRGYRRFRCRSCGRSFNERTGSLFNGLLYPPDVVCRVVLWRVRYKLSLRDLAEMCLDRGVTFTHEAVREWETKFAPVLSETLRKQRRGKIGASWYADETYLKVQGRWTYWYRAIDRDGNLVDAARYRLLMRSVRQLVRSSIQVADLVFLNKADLTNEKELGTIETDIRALMKKGAEIERVSAKNGLPVSLLDRVLVDHEA